MSPRRRAANGSGSIWKRRDGRWTAALYVTEADGRRVRQTYYGRSRTEVEAKLVEVRRRADSGVPMPPSRLTVESYLKEWLDTVVSKRVRPNTLAAYRFNVDTYLVPGLGAKKLRRLTARELRLYLASLETRGVGTRTIRYVHATLRAALEDAVREELLEKNVAKLVRPPAATRVERKPLGVDELKQLFAANADHRLRALLVVVALLGLRRSEALGLRWEDVDLDGGWLSVRHGLHRTGGNLQLLPTKTARSRRTIPLPSLVVRELADHRRRQDQERRDLAERWPDSGFVFTTPIGTPIDPDNCSKVIKAAVKAAGLREVRLHDFRHGLVSALLGLGVPPRTVMDIAGHSGLEMTMNVYGHVSLDDKREALDRFDRLFEGGAK
ncbi:MAG TPA: tyrosine-type recombinase/integrase [Marmoricola sp.]|nr:tyrosine-type recombinase/integrase [Marmoricola sp.]